MSFLPAQKSSSFRKFSPLFLTLLLLTPALADEINSSASSICDQPEQFVCGDFKVDQNVANQNKNFEQMMNETGTRHTSEGGLNSVAAIRNAAFQEAQTYIYETYIKQNHFFSFMTGDNQRKFVEGLPLQHPQDLKLALIFDALQQSGQMAYGVYATFYSQANAAALTRLQHQNLDFAARIINPIQNALMNYVKTHQVYQAPPPAKTPPVAFTRSSRDHTAVAGPAIFDSNFDLNPANAEEIAEMVGNIRFLNNELNEVITEEARNHLGPGEIPYALTMIASACGYNNDQAFFFNDPYARANFFFVCPQTLEEFTLSATPDAIKFVIAHEMGHSLHDLLLSANDSQNKNLDWRILARHPDFAEKKYTLDHRYEPYLSCMRTYYVPEAQNCDKMTSYFGTNILPDLIKAMTKQSAKSTAVPNKEYFLTSFHDSCTTNGPIWHGYDSEMISDQIAQELFIPTLKSLPANRRADSLKAAMHFACGQPEMSGDLQHPGRSIRIGEIFHHPAVRAMLGCPAKPADNKPFCSLSPKI